MIECCVLGLEPSSSERTTPILLFDEVDHFVCLDGTTSGAALLALGNPPQSVVGVFAFGAMTLL